MLRKNDTGNAVPAAIQSVLFRVTEHAPEK